MAHGVPLPQFAGAQRRLNNLGYPSFPSLPPLFLSSLSPLLPPFILLPPLFSFLRFHPLKPPKGSGVRCELPHQQFWAEHDQTVSVHSEVKNRPLIW